VNRLYTWNFLLAFLAQTAFTITNSLLAHYGRWVEFLGGNELDVGNVSSVSAFVGLVFRPLLAPWIDRLGPRFCWVVASIIVVAGSLANILLTDLGIWLYIIRSMMAVGIAIVFASGLTYIAHVTPVDRRAEAIGVLGAGGFVGLLIGPALGDFFLHRAQRTEHDFQLFFLTAALGVGFSVVLVLFGKPAPMHHEPARGWHPIDFLRTAVKYWPGWIMFSTFAFGVCMTVPFVFLSIFVDQETQSRVGPFFVVYATVGLTLRLGLRSWPDQFGAKRILMVGMAMFAAGMWLFLLATREQPYWLMVAGAVCGAAHGLTFHSMVTLVLEPFPPEHRGSGSTLALMGIDSGTFFGAQVLRFVIYKGGYPALFHAVAGCCVVAVIVLWWRKPTPTPTLADKSSAAA
jgi:MFS family permease